MTRFVVCIDIDEDDLPEAYKKLWQATNNYRIRHYTRIKETKFFGHRVLLHEAVHAPLECVQEYIAQVCDPYVVKAVSGWRPTNSYRGSEISNHVFGIALDINPDENKCCGCLGKWSKDPECSYWQRGDMSPHKIPECWVRAFESNGWAWLGYDSQLSDSMHFEYLAKPGAKQCNER